MAETTWWISSEGLSSAAVRWPPDQASHISERELRPVTWVNATASPHGAGDPRHLVGQRHADQHRWFARQHSARSCARPGPGTIRSARHRAHRLRPSRRCAPVRAGRACSRPWWPAFSFTTRQERNRPNAPAPVGSASEAVLTCASRLLPASPRWHRRRWPARGRRATCVQRAFPACNPCRRGTGRSHTTRCSPVRRNRP